MILAQFEKHVNTRKEKNFSYIISTYTIKPKPTITRTTATMIPKSGMFIPVRKTKAHRKIYFAMGFSEKK